MPSGVIHGCASLAGVAGTMAAGTKGTSAKLGMRVMARVRKGWLKLSELRRTIMLACAVRYEDVCTGNELATIDRVHTSAQPLVMGRSR